MPAPVLYTPQAPSQLSTKLKSTPWYSYLYILIVILLAILVAYYVVKY